MSLETPSSGQPPEGDGRPPARSRRRRAVVVALIAVVLVAVALSAYHLAGTGSSGGKVSATSSRHETTRSAATAAPATVARTTSPTTVLPGTSPTTAGESSTSVASAPSSHGPITSPPLPAPGPGFSQGQVTAVGDSVMLDYQTPLEQDIPGVNVQAVVSEQWSAGEAELQQLKSEGQLGAVVIVGLSTNGPITSTDFANMMAILSGASRVVFVTVHVDRPWQDANNAVLAAGVQHYPNTVLADWYDLVEQNPGWLYSDGTHLPIDGPGAQALANLVAAQA